MNPSSSAPSSYPRGVSFRRVRKVIHGHFCTVSQFLGRIRCQAHMGPLLDRYRSRQVQRHIQPSANEQVPPCQKIVRKDFGFVVGLMTERGPPVHVANGPNAFCRGFEKFIGFNIAPVYQP